MADCCLRGRGQTENPLVPLMVIKTKSIRLCMGKACSQKENTLFGHFNILKAKPTGKKPEGRPSRNQEENIIMDLK